MKKIFYTLLFKILTSINIIIVSTTLSATGQTDTIFWFAAPDPSPVYSFGNRQGDRPAVFWLIAGDLPAQVTVSQPAGGGMPTQTVNIPANSYRKLDITPWVDNIKNYPPNIIANKGIKISSDVPIQAHYFNMSGDTSIIYVSSPELFILKGKNALGMNFLIPSVDNGANDNGFAYFSYYPKNSISIIATENNTRVTIIPSVNLEGGGAAGTPINVTLNQGQSYAVRALSHLATGHLAGSKVTSDKAVAITASDDQVKAIGAAADLAGDQLLPITQLSKQYVAVNGNKYSPTTGDHIYVMATENNTVISIDGIVQTTINAGATWRMEMKTPAVFVEADKLVSLWQLSGVGFQAGMTPVPQLSICSGNRSVSYVSSIGMQLVFHVVVASGGENDFTVNGNATLLTSAQFATVPGTGGQWLYARLELPYASYPRGTLINVRNTTTNFQMAVLDGDQTSGSATTPNTIWGATYGYITNFGREALGGDFLGADTAICQGNTLMLDATTSGATGYKWSTGDTTPIIQVAQSGSYWVKLTGNLCVDKDTISVEVNPFPVVDLGSDTLICNISSLNLQSRQDYTNGDYQWNNNATTPSIDVSETGMYKLTVTEKGCSASDSIFVTFDTLLVDLGNDTVVCEGQSVVLNSSITYNRPSFKWNTGETSSSIRVSNDGFYILSVTDEDCTGSDSVRIIIPNLQQNLGDDLLLCEESPIDLNLQGNVPQGAQALWSTGETSSSIRVDKAGVYWVEVSQALCFGTDSVVISTKKCDCEVFMPNAFSPNGDGLNDVFRPVLDVNCPISGYSFQVFNRWGQLVFNSVKPHEGWNGKVSGKSADIGTYMYIVKYIIEFTEERTILKGDVILLK